MAKTLTSIRLLWFIVCRCFRYSFPGALMGAIGGAAYVSLAGCLIGFCAGLSGTVEAFGLAMFGGLFGLFLGAATGGVIGFIGWGVVGILYPASSMLSTQNDPICSTLVWIRNATIFALATYLSWCLGLGFVKQGFGISVYESLDVALVGVPALMGIGQIFGIWQAAIKLGKKQSEI